MYLLLNYVPRCCESDPVFEFLQGYLALLIFCEKLGFHAFPQDVFIGGETMVLNPDVEGHKVD